MGCLLALSLLTQRGICFICWFLCVDFCLLIVVNREIYSRNSSGQATRVHVRFVRGLCFPFPAVILVYNKKNITRWLKNTCMAKRNTSLVRFAHSDIKFIPSHHREISSVCNPLINFRALSLDKTRHVVKNGRRVSANISRPIWYPSSDFLVQCKSTQKVTFSGLTFTGILPVTT